MGMHARGGAWLSVLSGWRLNRITYIDLQMNDVNYKKQSLSAVMRAFMLEHEIEAGQQPQLRGRVLSVAEKVLQSGGGCTDIFLSRPGLRARLF